MPLPNKSILENADLLANQKATEPFVLPPINIPGFTPNVGPLGDTGGSGAGLSEEGKKSMALASFLLTPSPTSKPNLSSFYPYNPTDIDTSGRYNRVILGQDMEDLYGKMQSSWDKAANGLLKGVGIAGTTFLDGTVGLIAGIGSAIAAPSGKKMNAFYDNPFTNYMMELNKEMEDVLPNYYTAAERNAKWYEPDNLFTANFFWDKIIKNLGFSVGAIYSGYAVGGLVSAVPKIFGLSKVGKMAELSAKLEQGLQGVPELERAAKAKDIINQNAQLVKTIERLSASERLVTSGLAAATESGIEALQGTNDFRDKLIQQYKDTYGQEPGEAEMASINSRANDLGNSRFALNMLLLTGTNYIQLPKILGASYKAGKNNLVNAVRNNFETGVLESAIPTSGFSKILNRTKNIAGLFVSPTEGFEEGAQYAIEKGVEAYYEPGVNSYYNKGRFTKNSDVSDYLNSLWDAAGKGVKAVADKEGIESILIGALSGGMQQAGFVGTYRDEKGKLKVGIGKSGEIKERGWAGEGGELAKNTGDLISKGAPFSLKGDNWLKDNVEANKRAVNFQQDFAAAVRQGDVLEAKDAEFAYQHNYLFPRIKYGRYDLVQEDIEYYRRLASTQEGLDELKRRGIANQSDDIQIFKNRLSNFERNAKTVKEVYESMQLRFGSLIDRNTKQPLYSDEVIEKMTYAASKISDYDNRMKEIANELLAADINVSAINPYIAETVKKKAVPEEGSKVFEAVASSIEKLDIPNADKAEIRTKAKDYAEIALRRQNFLQEYNQMQKAPLAFTSQEISGGEGQTVKVKTKDGEKDINLGEEYFILGNTGGIDKKGPFHGKAKIKIVALTKKGEIIAINEETNEPVSINPDSLENFGLRSRDEMRQTPNGKLFIEHMDSEFSYSPTADEPSKTGRLAYNANSDSLRFVTNDDQLVYSITRDQFLQKAKDEKPHLELMNEEFTDDAADALSAPVSPEEILRKYQTKDALMKEVLDSYEKLLDDINQKLDSSKKQVDKAVEDINKIVLTTTGATKKKLSTAAKNAVAALSKLRDDQMEIVGKLESHKAYVESHVRYLKDLQANKDALPDNFMVLADMVKSDIKNLEDAKEGVEKAIVTSKETLNNAEKALKDALQLLQSFIEKLKSQNPDVVFFTGDLEQLLNRLTPPVPLIMIPSKGSLLKE
jgi:hypothetical protein